MNKLPPNTHKVLIVTGMHRSGTSALAGSLNTLGISVGSRLIPPSINENAKGFFEHQDVVAINDKLLASAGSTWDGISCLPPHWDVSINPTIIKDAEALIARELNLSHVLALKDPRFCLTADFWIHILKTSFNILPYFLISARHPQEVCSSLEKRNGFSQSKSSVLWLNHYLAIEKSTRSYQRLFIPYEQLLSAPLQTLSEIGTQLCLSWDSLLSEHASDLDNFLDLALRHHQKKANKQESPLISVSNQIYQIIAPHPTNLQKAQDQTILREANDLISKAEKTFSTLQSEQILQLSKSLHQASAVAEERTQWALEQNRDVEKATIHLKQTSVQLEQAEQQKQNL
nr:hypothetical protein [Kiritimatiellota bacterium]